MRGKRILAILMAVTLLGGTAAQAVEAREEGSRSVVEAPVVTVVGNHVTDTDKKGDYELSVYVQGDRFQTVGVVLSYDREKLTPVGWDNDTPIEATSGWTKILPTKGADDLAGKPALLCAKATAPAPDMEDTTDESGTETPESPAAAGREYLYLGAEALLGRNYSESETRVVTVRFLLAAEDTKISLPVVGQEESEDFDICLAADEEILGMSIPGMPLKSTVLDGSDLPVTYKYQQNLATEEGAAQNLYTVAFDTRDGASINTGSREPVGGGGSAITFFDWDGRAIDAVSADPETAKDVVEGWEALHGDRLSKPGYQFDRWLVVYENNDGKGLQTAGGTFTSNDEALPDNNPDAADLEHLFEKGNSVFLQAAYYAKTTAAGFDSDLVNGGSSSNADRQYSLSDPVFTRYGATDANSGSYSLTITVTREKNGNGVTRLREPAIWVTMEPVGGGDPIYNLLRLENTDETTFEIVTNKQIKRVNYKVIDVYKVTNWTGAGERSATLSKDAGYCITNGNLGYLAEQALAVKNGGSWETYVNAQTFADSTATFTVSNNKLVVTYPGNKNVAWWDSNNRVDKAKAALVAATGTTRLSNAEVLAIVTGVS